LRSALLRARSNLASAMSCPCDTSPTASTYHNHWFAAF
jgi:hypothetical protein